MKRSTFDLDDDVAKALTIYIAKATLANHKTKPTKNELVNRALRKLLGMKP